MFELAQDQDENLPPFEKLPFSFIFFSLFFTCLLPFPPPRETNNTLCQVVTAASGYVAQGDGE